MSQAIHQAPGGPPPAPQPPAADRRRWRALALLCLAQFMVILDVTVVNVALPELAADLALDRTAMTWVVTGYALCFGGLLMLGGRLADLLGRRTTFLTGLLLFTGASLLAGLAGNPATVLAARFGQGVAAALLSPAALSIVTTTFHGRERHRALGVWAAIGGSGAAAGVLVGGLLVSGPGWRWIFFVNVPIGLLVAALLPAAVAPTPRLPGRLDLPGALLVTAASGALVYGLVKAGDAGWDAAASFVPIAAAAVLYAAFAAVERRHSAPLVPARLFTHRPMVSGSALMLTASAVLLAGFFISSLFLQRVLGLSALGTGLVFLPFALATIVGAHLAGQWVGRFGPRPVGGVAFAVVAAGFALLTRVDAGSGTDGWITLLPGLVIAAVGLGAGFVTATTTALSHIEHEHAGAASGVINTGHELGGALGVAVVSTIAGAGIEAELGAGAAAVGGFTDAYWLCAVVAAVVAVAALRLLPAGKLPVGDGPVFAH